MFLYYWDDRLPHGLGCRVEDSGFKPWGVGFMFGGDYCPADFEGFCKVARVDGIS